MLKIYYNYPFVPGNEVNQEDTATGDGLTSLFKLVNKSSAQVGEAAQANLTLYHRYLNGLTTPDSTHVQLSSAPPANAQIVIPGQRGVLFDAFDGTDVPGETAGQANVSTAKFYVADDGTGNPNILVNTYRATPGNPGVAVLFQNLVTAAGASVTWTQLACADAAGNALTYAATGTAIYTDEFYALTSVTASGAALSTTLVVASATGIYPGDYVKINPGGLTEENPQITAINYASNTLTLTSLRFDHLAGEYLYMNGRAFWGKVIFPVGVLAGVAQEFINLCLSLDAIVQAR